MILPKNWLIYYVAMYQYIMKMTHYNHDMEDYIDYHGYIDYYRILHITCTA